MRRWILVGALALATVQGACAQSVQWQTNLLNYHNTVRRQINSVAIHGPVLGNLEWNSALAAGADAWAKSLAKSGNLTHSPNAFTAYGENIADYTAGQKTPTQMAEMFWVTPEKADFKVGWAGKVIFGNAVAQDGNWYNVAHYTQMIWRHTTKVGCGLATGHGMDFLVCRYLPPGNRLGQSVY
jgi:hypothetical protein